jgi:glycosyltransferase involved in cell wall biosynthesis
LWYWWFEWSLPRILKKHQVDVFFSPDSFLSLRTKVKTVMTIQDIIPLQNPEGNPWLVSQYYQYFLPKYIARADRLAAISNYVKNSLLDKKLAESDKITVVLNGCDDKFKPSTELQKKEIKAKYSSGCDFFFYTGAIHPRKNVDGLIKAFDLYKKTTNNDAKLLLIGRLAWDTQAVTQANEASPYRDDIRFLGYISGDDLVAITGAALALVLISVNEGFGLPVVEAMKCDTPVICSNITALAEVGEGAALLVNPLDLEEVKEAMLSVSNPEKRAEIIENQRVRRGAFSWDRAAEEVWGEIENCL